MLLALPAAASAHGGATTAVDYRSLVTGTPAGVDVHVVGGDDRLAVTRDGADQVIVLGYDGEPYLRLDDDGVWENERSPAVGLNAERQQGAAAGDADPKAEPSWRKLSGGDTVLFHDHRAHWMGSQPPAAVRDDPDTARRLADWSVPVLVDGQAGAITGYYRYEPPPSKALWLGVLAALALAASVVVWRLKGPRRRLALWILAGAAVLPAPILGAAETLDLPDPGRRRRRRPGGLHRAHRGPGRRRVVGPPRPGGRGRDPGRRGPRRRRVRAGGAARAARPRRRAVGAAGRLARGLLVLGLAATIAVAVGAVATWRDTLARVPTKGGRARPPRKEPEEAW